MPSSVASSSASFRARSVVPATAQPAPASVAPPWVTVISGCRPKPSCGRKTSSPVAPEQCPTTRPLRGSIAIAAAAICASGTQSSTTSAPSVPAPRASGPRTGRPAAVSAAASAGPRRPRPTMAIVLCIYSDPAPGFRGAGRRGCLRSVARSSRRADVYHRPVPPTKEERREALKAVYHQAKGCTNCPQLAATRTTVVFGNGNADADLMFVGEAPGANEDRQGLPFVGQAGKLLDTLLGEIGLVRADVFVCNVLKCRPPGNRDPHPAEIEACQSYLLRQVELIEPRVICTLGNFATKLLRGDPTGITRLHGRDEARTIGRRAVRLYPLFHPAAALYTPANVEVLRADSARIPELLGADLPPQPEPVEEAVVPIDDDVPRALPEPDAVEREPEPVAAGPPAEAQLGLF